MVIGTQIVVQANTVTELARATGATSDHVLIINRGTGSIWVGGDTVDTTGANIGCEIPVGEDISTVLENKDDVIYCKCTAAQRVDVFRTGA